MAFDAEKIGEHIVPTHERIYLGGEGSGEYIEIEKELLNKLKDLRSRNPNFTDPDTREALLAAEKIAGANCHKTALYLTGYMTLEELFDPRNHEVETSGHVDVANEENTEILPQPPSEHIEFFLQDLSERLSFEKYPLRITFFQNIERDNELFPKHSVTIIGQSSEGQLLAFEKEDAYGDNPFQDIDFISTSRKYLQTGHQVGIQKR